jgi:hypothetical protein
MQGLTSVEAADRRAEARMLAKLNRIALVERGGDGGSFVFGRRLELNVRANTWSDLKTGESGIVKCSLPELLRRYFPQLVQVQNGGSR